MIDTDKFALLFNNMFEGVALHRYVYDSQGKVINYIIEDANPAFEKILGIIRPKIIGKLATEVYSVSEPPYLEEYSNLNNEPRQFEVFFAPLKKYFFISVSPWGNDGFATIFYDITERKKMEEDLKRKNEEFETINRLMVDRELKMVELKKDLKKLEK
jgi:PAS domain S-box-containing protein